MLANLLNQALLHLESFPCPCDDDDDNDDYDDDYDDDKDDDD